MAVVSEGLSVEWVAVASLVPYARNPRKNDVAVAKVAASLREYGWRQPLVVDEELTVIAGHTRLMAARSLGMATVPVHIAKGLTQAQVRAYRIADNRTGQEAEWDFERLAAEMSALGVDGFDLSLTGFNSDEIASILQPDGGILDGADVDAVPEVPTQAITLDGDRILLGRHTLVCGSATDAGTWEKLLAGRTGGAMWTDPPYGVSYVGKTKDALTIANDAQSIDELTAFLRSALTLAWTNCRAGGAWYVAAPSGPQFLAFASVLTELKVWRQTLVWVKHCFALGRSDYHYRHEAIFEGVKEAALPGPLDVIEHGPIVYGWKEGEAHQWSGGRKQDTVLEFPKPSASRQHPTIKPVALIQRCLENSTRANDLILDPFGGSGSTLIASEALGMSAALIELSPAYCDVIVTRWETATGQKAVRP